MNTFLPYPSFERSAKCLDGPRLGKQRIEVVEILTVLSGEQPEWMSDHWYTRCLRHKSHPAVKMWRGYEEALIDYGCAICDEWIARGYKDNQRPRIVGFSWGEEVIMPWWLGNPVFHYSHKSNLVRKRPQHYREYFPEVFTGVPYYWPINENAVRETLGD